MPRRPRQATGGHIFHVLNRAAGRQRLFDSPHDYAAFQKVLREGSKRIPLRLLAYIIMPNHWHIVVWPRDDDEMPDFFHWVATTHSQRWHAAHGTAGTGPVYQGRYKSFPVEGDDHFYGVCRYAERNAQRANLVTRPELWRWSSLWQWEQQSGEVPLAAWPLPRPTRWREYVHEPQTEAELQAIRRCVQQGCPYGSREWQRTTARSLGIDQPSRSRGRPPRIE